MKLFSLCMGAICVVAPALVAGGQDAGSQSAASNTPQIEFPNVLYGAAYYNEYMPQDTPNAQAERLEKDVALMKAAGLSVVRMGESTWSLWEPEDGRFEYAWMDHIVDAMSKAGIKVILGTPTYSLPAWMAHQHPEIFAERIPPGPFGGKPVASTYGIRQNMDTDSPVYRFYAERLIRHIVAHYKDNADVIGWQLDNETSSYDAANTDVFIGFQHYLEKKFGTPEELSKAWFLNYWGENLHSWEDLPRRDGTISTGYKLEWTRWSQMRVTDFLHWQAGLVRECASPRQFVTTDYGSMMKRDVNEEAVAQSLDIIANNIYHGTQDHYDGSFQALQSDFSRSLKHANFLVTETNAQTIGWTSQSQFPPYDGQLREDVYTYLSNGANMVEYWHWASIAGGQETYWKGILSHDLEPNREYAEMSRTAHELEKIGPHLVGLKIKAEVAILWSRDSANAIDFMPYGGGVPARSWTGTPDGYASLVQQMHHSLYELNVPSDFVFPETQDFSAYKLLIVPALYISDDALLKRISDYVKNGGHVVMTFKSGFANENSAVRWVRAPGPLREAAGFSYQEFSNLEKPLALKGDPLHAGEENKVYYWAEFLMPEHAKAIAFYDHPFFGKWPAITENSFGSGTLLYEGTYLSDAMQTTVLRDAMQKAGLSSPDQQLPASVHVQHGVSRMGKRLHYYFNYSAGEVKANYGYGAGTNLLDGKAVAKGAVLTLGPWDLAIVEEN
jgi:beta-galactosidase